MAERSDSIPPLEFAIHSCYYNSFFLLRTPVSIGGKPVEVGEYRGYPQLKHRHSEEDDPISVPLSEVSRIVGPVLHKYGVYHIDTFYHEKVPLFSVVFRSKDALKQFLSHSQDEVKRELEKAISQKCSDALRQKASATKSRSTILILPVDVEMELYLVAPNRRETGKSQVYLVTLDSYSHYLSEWEESKLFSFESLFTDCKGVQDKEANLDGLLSELGGVIKWFRFGLKLGIPEDDLLITQENHIDVHTCLRHVLIEWGRRERRTWSKVVSGLAAIGRMELARRISAKYRVPVPEADEYMTPQPAAPQYGITAQDVGHAEPAKQKAQETLQTLEELEKDMSVQEQELSQSMKSKNEVYTKKDIVKQNVKEFSRREHQLHEEIRSTRAKFQERVEECVVLRKTVSFYMGKQSDLEDEENAQIFRRMVEEKEEQIRKLESHLEKKEKELEDTQNQLQQLTAELDKATRELREKCVEKQQLEAKVEELRGQITKDRKKFDSERQQMAAKEESQEKYIKKIQVQLSTATEETKAKSKEVKTFQQKVAQQEKQVASLSEEVQTQETRIKTLQQELSHTAEEKNEQILRKQQLLLSLKIEMSDMKIELVEAEGEKQHAIMQEKAARTERETLQKHMAHLKRSIPDPKQCIAVVIPKVQKHLPTQCTIHLLNEDGDPCTGSHVVTGVLRSLASGSATEVNTVSKSPDTYELSYTPHRSGRHEVIVKVNGREIQGSPFTVSVHNVPDPKKCTATGAGTEVAQKHQLTQFEVRLADEDGEPCTDSQEVTAVLKSLADGSTFKVDMLCMSPDTYKLSYTSHKSGEHELAVKVNGSEIQGSPFKIFVYNTPDPKKCTAVGPGINRVEKHNLTQFEVHLADEDGEPCNNANNTVTAVIKSLTDGSTTEADSLCKSPDMYELSYTPHRSREHEVIVKVNGREIQGSPFTVSVYNVPDPKKCIATGAGTELAQKHQLTQFEVHLADEDGEPCTDSQEVTAVLKSLADGSTFKVDMLCCMSPKTYKLSYTSHKLGEHELAVKVNGSEIQRSPFKLFVFNTPAPKKCTATGPGIHRVEKHNLTQFEVHLADEDGEPCNDANNTVTAVMKSLTYGSTTKADTLCKSPDIYELSYTPHRSREHEVIVKVNGREIQGSPFTVSVYNVPYPKKCIAIGVGTKLAQKHQPTQFQVHLVDEDGEPCNDAGNSVTAVIKSLTYRSTTEAGTLCESPDTYKLSYTLHRSGEHYLIVNVNGNKIQGSPFTVSVYNVPYPKKCTATGLGTKLAPKHQLTQFEVHLADEDGEPCTDSQEVTAVLKSLVDGSTFKVDTLCMSPKTYKLSYTSHKLGEHELAVKVNGSEVQGSPFKLFVYNTPDPKKCTAVGPGIHRVEKHQLTQFEVHLADEDGEPCNNVSHTVSAIVKSLTDGSTTEARTLCKSLDTYELSYTPHRSGKHDLTVKVNGREIQRSPFTVFVYNVPDPKKCTATGAGTKLAQKHQVTQFQVHLADEDGESCNNAGNSVTTVIKSIADGSTTEARTLYRSLDTYKLSYTPHRSGEHEIIVKVNGREIQGSPFTISVYNVPDPKKCTATGTGTEVAQKHQVTQFQVHLADEDGESCNNAGNSVTTVIKSLTDGSTTEARTLCKSPDTYKLSYTPHRSGKHEVTVKVNGREIQRSPFTVFVYNVPDPKKCTATGAGTEVAQKHQLTQFEVHLVGEDGEPCNAGNSVTTVIKSLTDGSTTEARTLCKSPDTYKLSYTPHRSGEHEIIVKVNGSEIQGSPFTVSVYNVPDPKKCTATGTGTKLAYKHQVTQFQVHLADEDGESCNNAGNSVTTVIKSLTDGSTTEARTLCKSPDTYELSYTPHTSGKHEVTVKVNGREIQGSPFTVSVYNPYKMLLIGEVGSGKTSFLNLLCNCALIQALGCKFDEDGLARFRQFTDIKLENEQSSQMESHTCGVKLYNVYLDELKAVGIIDTPGFGDSRGMEQDKKNTGLIIDALRDEEYVNCVCLVINGRQSRMSATLQYILSEVTAILPKEVLNNVIVVFTDTADALDLNFDPNTLDRFLGQRIRSQCIFYIENPYCRFEKAKMKQGQLPMEMIARNLKKSFEEAAQVLGEMCTVMNDFKMVHTHCFVVLYEKKQEIEKGVLNLLTANDNQRKIETMIAKAQEEADAALKTKTLNTNFRSTETIKRTRVVPAQHHNTLCGAPGCYSNCHVRCSLPKSFDYESFKQCNTCFQGTDYCRKCGHHYTLHRHNEAMFTEEEYTREFVDRDMQHKFQQAKTMEERVHTYQEQLKHQLKQSKSQGKWLSEKLLLVIKDFHELGINQNYAELPENQLAVIQLHLDGTVGPEAQHLRKCKEDLQKKLQVVKQLYSIL